MLEIFMEIKNETENIQEPLTNESGCSNDHHFRRVKTAIAEGQNKCAVAVKEASRPTKFASGCFEDQQWLSHCWLKTRNIGVKVHSGRFEARLRIFCYRQLISQMSKFLYELQSAEQLAVKASSSANAQPNVHPDVVAATPMSATHNVIPREHAISV
ncbi:hypothetical protein T10_7055 [Trichinella papuae]|uniref:Uncharacterized protein n=1 Tax=Trichinella papuae TaxID=268474 RepID=A0A0V1N213_9BILA|nr:hypothetical protein T10_7055 [Trichinella papuae]